LSALEDNDIVMDYLLQFDDDNAMAALTSNVNKVYRVQQKGKKQQHTLMHMWEMGTRLHF
jgi:hypothetical protein